MKDHATSKFLLSNQQASPLQIYDKKREIYLDAIILTVIRSTTKLSQCSTFSIDYPLDVMIYVKLLEIISALALMQIQTRLFINY